MTLPANTTTVQKAIVKEAYKYLGKPYVWGAKGPNTFDCSGLTYYVYMQATGHYIGGWTGEQQYAGTQIPVDQAQPGDLVFWGPSSGITHHVGIYIGNGQFIHAPQPGDKVRITSIADYKPDFAVRVNVAGLPLANGLVKPPAILDGSNDSFHFSKNQTTDQFLKKIADSAQEIGQKEGIYASVMMAQAILESGSGNSLLSSEPNYNLFGIKGTYQGKSVSFNTLEQDAQGANFQIRATFRKYPSYKESLYDEFDYKVFWGCDLQTEHERYLTEKIFKRPVFVTDYPKEIKAFYMKMNEDGRTVAAMDCLVPGIGEIIGGSQREDDYDKLVARMDELGLKKEDYGFYLDLRKYGSVRHSGFGLGFERCVMYLTGMGNIRDVIPFPRTVNNCEL